MLQSRAEITEITRDGVTFKFHDVAPGDIQKYIGKMLKLKVSLFRNGRSIDANNYFHALNDEMAEKVDISPLEMHNILLSKYGLVDDDMPHVKLDDNIDWTRVKDLHLRTVPGSWDPAAGTIEYEVIRGTHTYDTAEMSQFLDEVIIDAKLMGIDPRTPDEIRRDMEAVNGNKR